MLRIFSVVAITCLLAANPSAVAAPQSASQMDASVLAAADELAAAVRAQDRGAFLRLVGPQGVRCIGDVVSRQELRKELRAGDTWFGAYFFAPQAFREKFADAAYPTSFAEFLATARDLRVTAVGNGTPLRTCVRFVAANIKPAHLFCFTRVGRRWVLGTLPNCG